jgi:hypothetical protein
MPIFKHFFAPHKNSSLTPNLPYNKNSTIGSMLQCVVDDRIIVVTYEIRVFFKGAKKQVFSSILKFENVNT